jgi:hypothetical protein
MPALKTIPLATSTPAQMRPAAEPDDEQLGRIRALEDELGLSLIAVEASPG